MTNYAHNSPSPTDWSERSRYTKAATNTAYKIRSALYLGTFLSCRLQNKSVPPWPPKTVLKNLVNATSDVLLRALLLLLVHFRYRCKRGAQIVVSTMDTVHPVAERLRKSAPDSRHMKQISRRVRGEIRQPAPYAKA